jgi:hypothetical protein
MTVSARTAIGQEKVGKEKGAPKRKFTAWIIQEWSRRQIRPLAVVGIGPQALWQRMAMQYQRAWERSATDGAYRMLCWPSQARLAADMNVTVQTIRRWTRALEAAGLIEVDVVATPGATSCLLRCHYALVAPMRVGAMQAPRKRAPQSARGFAREGYVRTPRTASRATSRVEVEARRDRKQEEYIEKIAATNPQEAAAFRAIEAMKKASERVQRDIVPVLDTSDPVKIAAEVAMLVPNISLGKAAHMARTNPQALAQAMVALRDIDTDSLANPAGYLVGIFNNISKRDRIRGLSHAA